MDPRKAATVSDSGLKDAFTDGFDEGRPDKTRPLQSYVVILYDGDEEVARRQFTSHVKAFLAIKEHLVDGDGTRAEIEVVVVAELEPLESPE